ncbi:cytosine permease [Endozoicomonas elysicola]|uniref:cytosine permease n=1 Tax=Endozoicomonas elysicola TaxID=305900 RepID=UPI00036720AA|nr:cytosine permease [Endozoicomonas elysicola]
MSDYERTAVPRDARRGFWQITSVWVGYVFILVSMMAGAGMAAGMSLETLFWAILVGNLFLTVVSSLMSIIAYKTGYTFALICRFSFGSLGAKIPAIMYAFIQLGWYVIQAALFGHLIAVYFELSPFFEALAMIASCLFMGLFALKGMRWMSVVGLVSIPTMIMLCLATAMRAVQDGGGWAAVAAFSGEETMDFMTAVGLVLGTWIFGASTTVADFNRFARSSKHVVAGCATGLLIVNSFIIGVGAIVGAASQQWDLVEILFGLGLVIPAFVLLTTNLWTTNSANLYSVGLTLSSVFPKTSRQTIMIGIMILASVLSLFKPYEIGAVFAMLKGLSIIVPPLTGIVLIDFYFLWNRQYPGHIENLSFKTVNPYAILAWLAGIGVAISFDIGFASLNAMAGAAFIYALIMKATHLQMLNTDNEHLAGHQKTQEA